MKALIVSDIHGSLDAARKIEKLAPSYDIIICLGDILYHGPRNDLPQSYNPKAVIPIMNSLQDRIIAVRGNCEAEVDQMVLSFPVMSTTAIVFADSFSLTLTHGHIYNEENPVPGSSVMLYGHTHIPVAHEKDGIVFFNPGSMSIPKGGFKATYGEYCDGVLSVRDLEDSSIVMSYTLQD